MDTPAQPGASGQYLTFTLDQTGFGVDVPSVREIVEFGGLTDVPMMPPCVRGVINLRGAVVPVIDLAARFGRPRMAIGRRTCIVIIEHDDGGDGRHVTGMMVDAVSAVVEIAPDAVEPPPAFGTRLDSAFVRGIATVNGAFVVLLEIARVVASEDIRAMLAAGGAADAAAVSAAQEG
ncbi:MAG TPA: chemotaxis protein CheW [Burkholderiaceae bacterium]